MFVFLSYVLVCKETYFVTLVTYSVPIGSKEIKPIHSVLYATMLYVYIYMLYCYGICNKAGMRSCLQRFVGLKKVWVKLTYPITTDRCTAYTTVSMYL